MFTAPPPSPLSRSYRHAANGREVHQLGEDINYSVQFADLLNADGRNATDTRQQLQQVVEALQRKYRGEKQRGRV